MQKATELGVTNFVPIIAERTEKLGFDDTRAMRIVIEAAEQCGRSDIPHVREPLGLSDAVGEYKEKFRLFVCEQGNEQKPPAGDMPEGALVGPEGGWSENELQLFAQNKLPHIGLGEHTLRAETAAIIAAGKLVQ
jgi:16S rRNA (uracil1498-N3)-methyltransferase